MLNKSLFAYGVLSRSIYRNAAYHFDKKFTQAYDQRQPDYGDLVRPLLC